MIFLVETNQRPPVTGASRRDAAMSDVTLLDYCNEDGAYLFNLETGELILSEKSVSAEDRIAGYASRKRIGVLRSIVIPVVMFCEKQRLNLWISGIKVDLCSDAVRGKVRLVAPFIREFCLMRGGQVLFTCDYWHSGWRVWPDDGDIFSAVENVTASPETVVKAHRIWTARLAGRPFIDAHK